jgi:AraC-like DNA-binding protein
MIDPLTEVVTLLAPSAAFSKVVHGAGAWRVRRTQAGTPFYCVVLDGAFELAIDGGDTLIVRAGDFILIPAAFGYTTSSIAPSTDADLVVAPTALPNGEFRLGAQTGRADVQLLIGHCVFGSPDAQLLVSLLPQLVHVRGEQRLSTLVQLVGDESRARRPGREAVLARLLEVLLIEALRSTADTHGAPGLLRGLADERLAVALRRMHGSMARAWTVTELAKEAALSRSVFFTRFSRAVGIAPMAYLLRWRMALAKQLLRHAGTGVAEVAGRVGYGSASAFSVAFTRHVGQAPTSYARAQPAEAAP